MKKIQMKTSFIFTAFLMSFLAAAACAQTVTLNDGSVLRNNPYRIGVNIGALDFYDNGQLLKNLIGSSNPGFEPLINRQIWALPTSGTTTTFSVPNIYDGVPANYWTGATFSVVESQSGGAELGCSGIIASNTGPNYPVATAQDISPVITVATPCAAPFSVGDIITITQTTFPTPESWWETDGRGGITGAVSAGGKLLSDTTDLCATCGRQALAMNASASGSSATATYWFDGSNSVDTFVLMNGTYQLSFWAKAAAGSPKLVASALRLSQGGFNCGSYTPTLTSTWTQYTFTCQANETVGTLTPGTGQVQFATTGGTAYLDNINFEKTSSSINNPTVFRDEVIETLQDYYGNSSEGPRGVFRDWLSQNGETIDNWTQPDYAHSPSAPGGGYFIGPGGSGNVGLSLEDYLAICQLIHADPYLEVPVTVSTTEAENLIEFLAGPSSSTYGARRSALGQVNPWTDVFTTIHLSFCNECWNGFSFAGQSLPDRSNQPNNEFYYDYSSRARDIFAAMRSAPDYASSSFDLVMNAQTATNYTMDIAINRAHPDSIEIEDYTYSTVNDSSSDSALWGPAMVEPYLKVTTLTEPKNFYRSVTDYQSQSTCGASGKTPCKVNIYEWGQGTINGSIDQTHLDYINAGAGEGVVMALQPLLNLQYFGITPQSFFSLTEFENSGPNGETAKLWGNVVDMGGSTGNKRPPFLGVSLVNGSIIGPEFACPISNNLTYNFAGSVNGNGSTPAISNVPYLYAFCFESGTQRSLVLVNTDMTASHKLTIAGSNAPTGTVTQRQFAPSSLDLMNEAPTGTSSNDAPAKVAIETSSISNPTSITLPPNSVTALDYTAQSQPVASPPTFSPTPGSYTAAQPVTITSTPGAAIHYTIDGSTPTTSSPVYSAPITVSTSETIKAMAVASGFANSTVASGSYVIAPVLPAPAFSIAAGTFTAAQTVALSDSASGASVYYTTNGTTPTSSSTKYTGPITVSASETIEAIAIETGYTSSSVASEAFVVAPILPAPVFSIAAGTYSNTQTVAITDTVPGATIYYALNHAPTTASSVYSGPITVSATETVEALAIASGYTNSQVASAAYTISGSTSYVNYANGFSGSSLKLNGGASVDSTNLLEITDGGQGEARSAWFSSQVPVQSFVTDFTFEQLSPNGDGMTFAIQGTGLTAVGNAGSGLGYQNIGKSAAVKFDLYSNAGEGPDSTGLYTNGAIPTVPAVNLSSTPINLHSGHVMDAHLVYDGTNLTMTLTDTVTNAAVTEVFPVNIASLVGSSSAYVGFTGGTGGSTSTQKVLSWTYVSSGAASSSSSTVATPAFSPAPGSYTAAQPVTISDATSGATIYYTTNGTTPTASSTKYTGSVTVSATETLKAIAVKTGATNSAVASGTYTITPVLTAPAFSAASGTYAATQSVAISDATAGAVIHYTTDGSTPTSASTVYSSPLSVAATATLKAIAVETGYTNSPVTTATYTITRILPPPTFSVAAGTYSSSQSVSISDAIAGTTIYYTTNGATPTTSSSVYSGPITVSATETIEAMAIEAGYTNSSVATSVYTIAASKTYINLASGAFNASSFYLNHGASIASGALQVTDGGEGEYRSAWFTTRVPVQSFTTDFTFQQTNALADGMTFTIQGQKSTAVGGNGSGLGYFGIPTSVAIKFDLYSNAGEGPSSTGLFTNGSMPTTPSVDLTSAGINLHSGDVMQAHLVYNGTTLTMTLTDTVTKATTTKAFTVNIPGIVGGTTAYIGFTGGTGGKTAVQKVLTWSYSVP